MKRREFLGKAGSAASWVAAGSLMQCVRRRQSPKRPNILWIIAEDMSCNFSCYGEKTIQTPNIDKLAGEGVKFEQVFVTCPVCSPSRSALISGMYQTKLGAHNHRSQRNTGSLAGEADYHSSYSAPVKLLPQLLQEAGYYTTLGGKKGQQSNLEGKNLSKSDYNFVWSEDIYNANDWKNRKPEQPFFAQIQLQGGKKRSAKVSNPVNPDDVTLPPYYPDHPVMRQDWARYLNSVLSLDSEIGEIMNRLEKEGIVENTVVFFVTDHGISHLRGKQFLYDEGIKVPLIIRWPGVIEPDSVRRDLVSFVDIAATTLAIAGIKIPDHIDGRDLFAKKYVSREYIAAARDRCDETVECLRCIRTDRYKYIRNYFSDKPHMQHNQYKDNKEITKVMRQLYADSKLDPVQSRIFAAPRPAEELYDLQNDPWETENLAGSSKHQDILNQMREKHVQWMRDTRDMGLIPEPELEELGRKNSNKYFVLHQPENETLVERIREVIELGEKGLSSLNLLIEKLSDESPSVRFRAAYAIGNIGMNSKPAVEKLSVLLNDESGAVRIVSARALCFMGLYDQGLPVLRYELKTNRNHVVRHYAALYCEEMGEQTLPYLQEFISARNNDHYEYVKRICKRLVYNLKNGR